MAKSTNKEKIKRLEEIGGQILKEIKKGNNPFLDVPIRALSNVNFNEKKGILELGDSKSKRYFFNISHIRKFVQTVGVMNQTKELLKVDKKVGIVIGAIGTKKKKEIVAKANEMKIKVLNKYKEEGK